MPSHPNRSRRDNPAANPSPEQIKAAREQSGLSQAASAALVYSTTRAWERWEGGQRRMHPAIWELFLSKACA